MLSKAGLLSELLLPDFVEFDSLIDYHHKDKREQTQQPGGHGNVIHLVSHRRLKIHPQFQVQEGLNNLAQQPVI